MPFVAENSRNKRILPAEAESGTSYRCPECGGRLSLRRSHYRDGAFVSSHFYHSQDADCPGESERHLKMKAIAMSKAAERWKKASVETEVAVGTRRADVLVEFDERKPAYGHGIAIECQHKNVQKNTSKVSRDYLDNGYSVLWLREKNYSGHNVDFDMGSWERCTWARDVPAADNWTGYHGVVHWLRQEKPTSVQIEIPLPTDRSELSRKVALSWEMGRRDADGASVEEHNGVCIERPSLEALEEKIFNSLSHESAVPIHRLANHYTVSNEIMLDDVMTALSSLESQGLIKIDEKNVYKRRHALENGS